ncbi:MAG: hypothetical protein ACFCBW_13380 [Candidatus Competibacterales bacterium]
MAKDSPLSATLDGPWGDQLRRLAELIEAIRSQYERYLRWIRYGVMALLSLLALAMVFVSGWAVLGLVLGAIIVSFFRFKLPAPGPLRQLVALLARWGGDAHSRSPLVGEIDGARLSSGEPVREARSPGGKMKRYYRRPLGRFRFALADGNLLAVDITGKAKVKAGQTLHERYHIRGRLKLNPSRYTSPEGGWQVDNFQVRPVQNRGERHLCFWGDVDAAKTKGKARGAPALGTWRPLDAVVGEIYRRLQGEGAGTVDFKLEL